MGRLFWKFLFLISFAQLIAVVGLGNVLWMWDRSTHGFEPRPQFRPRSEFAVDAAAAALENHGDAGLQDFMQSFTHPPVFALDEQNLDLQGHKVPDEIIEKYRSLSGQESGARFIRRVKDENGRELTLFAPGMPFEVAGTSPGSPRGMPPGLPRGMFRGPMLTAIASLVGSLICAVLLARYMSKPIRSLRTAFASAASGDLETRVAPSMARRNDELANLGRDFDRMATQLKALLENQRQLFHSVSHELRSPLARLQIAAGLARQHPDSIPGAMERIERECKRLDELVEELLTLSKLETGALKLAADNVDIAKIIRDIVADAGFESAQDRRPISFDYVSEPTIVGQAELLHRAIENAVRNALSYTPVGSLVRVSLAQIDGQRVRIAIDDDGPGVAETELASIFLPFFRGANSERTPGYGLGLAITKQIVEAHGGSVRAFNREGGGLRVEIDLPVRNESES